MRKHLTLKQLAWMKYVNTPTHFCLHVWQNFMYIYVIRVDRIEIYLYLYRCSMRRLTDALSNPAVVLNKNTWKRNSIGGFYCKTSRAIYTDSTYREVTGSTLRTVHKQKKYPYPATMATYRAILWRNNITASVKTNQRRISRASKRCLSRLNLALQHWIVVPLQKF